MRFSFISIVKYLYLNLYPHTYVLILLVLSYDEKKSISYFGWIDVKTHLNTTIM